MIHSVPSYVTPGTWAENLRFLSDKDWVQSVELLFFIYDDETRRLVSPEFGEIRDLGLRGKSGGGGGRFDYTVHLPDVLLPGHEELIELTAPFVRHWVVHPHDGLLDFLPTWRGRYGDRFLLENTRSEEAFLRTLKALDDGAGAPWPVCADVGHLALHGAPLAPFLSAWGDRIREIHLHGVAAGKDHVPVSGAEPWFSALSPFLAGFPGVLEHEVFSYDEVCASRAAVLAALPTQVSPAHWADQ